MRDGATCGPAESPAHLTGVAIASPPPSPTHLTVAPVPTESGTAFSSRGLREHENAEFPDPVERQSRACVAGALSHLQQMLGTTGVGAMVELQSAMAMVL